MYLCAEIGELPEIEKIYNNMYLRNIKLFCAFMAAMALTACSDGGSLPEVGSISVERMASLTRDNDSPTCQVSLNMAFLKGPIAEVANAVNSAVVKQLFDMEGLTLEQAADSFANKYTRDYVKNFAPLYRDDHGDEQKRAWYNYIFNMNTRVESRCEHVVTYFTELDYYEGGAHGINQLLTMNFDDRTGEQITLSDIFVPGYQPQLEHLLLEKLLESTGAKDLDDLHDKGYLYSMDMFAPENFVLDDDGITFIYNPYEIAPYSMGKTELSVSKKETDRMRK